MIESAQSFGSSSLQMLFKVKLPQALPSIMLGVNPVSYTHLTLPTTPYV